MTACGAGVRFGFNGTDNIEPNDYLPHPPTLNLDTPSPACDGMDLVPHRARERAVRAVLSNSFGFGGTNASVVLAAYR